MEVEEQPSAGVSPDEILPEPFPVGAKKRNRKRRTIVFIVAILLNAGLLVLLGSQLLTPAQNQSHSWNSCRGRMRSTLPCASGGARLKLGVVPGTGMSEAFSQLAQTRLLHVPVIWSESIKWLYRLM